MKVKSWFVSWLTSLFCDLLAGKFIGEQNEEAIYEGLDTGLHNGEST